MGLNYGWGWLVPSARFARFWTQPKPEWRAGSQIIISSLTMVVESVFFFFSGFSQAFLTRSSPTASRSCSYQPLQDENVQLIYWCSAFVMVGLFVRLDVHDWLKLAAPPERAATRFCPKVCESTVRCRAHITRRILNNPCILWLVHHVETPQLVNASFASGLALFLTGQGTCLLVL